MDNVSAWKIKIEEECCIMLIPGCPLGRQVTQEGTLTVIKLKLKPCSYSLVQQLIVK